MGSGLNKIRGRENFLNRKGYKEFIKKYPKSETSYEEYILILKESNLKIKDCILTNDLGFKLPYNLGYVAVDKFKGGDNFVAIDWINSRRLNKKVPIPNLHTFGYTYKIKLYKNPRSKPFQVYGLKPHRILNRTLAHKIKVDKKDYLSIDPAYFSERFKIENSLKYNHS